MLSLPFFPSHFPQSRKMWSLLYLAHFLRSRKGLLTSVSNQITHEYKLIKGFAAKAPAKVLETVQTWGNDYHALIEEDQMVSIVGNSRS